MPAAISRSVRSTVSSTSSRTIENVCRFSSPIPPPSESASVSSSSTITGLPALRQATIAAPRSMQTPITRVLGDIVLTASATPANSPPPESGTRTASSSGASAMISSPSVPCPAITSALSKGGMSTNPSSATSRSTSSCASSWLLPTMRASAPSAFIASTLLAGTSEDMQITARAPAALAAWASARP